MSEINDNALNDAAWAWVDAWNERACGEMPGRVWNEAKPMLRAAIECYLSRIAAAPPAPSAEPVELITKCRDALAEELSAWDIDPPLHHVKQAHDDCVAWLADHAPSAEPTTECTTCGAR
jgi:hypothetical protein